MKPSDLLPREGEAPEVGVRRLVGRLRARWLDGGVAAVATPIPQVSNDIKFQGDTDSFLTHLTQAKGELEASDDSARISDGIMGWAALEIVGLTEQEQAHVLGMVGNAMRFSLIRPHLESPCSHGSYQARPASLADAGSYGHESYLIGGDEYWDEPWHDQEDWWHQEDRGDAQGESGLHAVPEDTSEATTISAESSEVAPGVADEDQAVWCEESATTYRQARQHLNFIRTGRRFGKCYGKDKGGGKGKGGNNIYNASLGVSVAAGLVIAQETRSDRTPAAATSARASFTRARTRATPGTPLAIPGRQPTRAASALTTAPCAWPTASST